jgi:hypothetical protein
MGVATPVRGSETVDVGIECRAVEFRPWIVFTESRVNQEVCTCDRRTNNLGGLNRPVKVAANQHRSIKFVRAG